MRIVLYYLNDDCSSLFSPFSGVVMSVSTGIPYYILFVKRPFKLTTIRRYWGKFLYYDRGKSNSVEINGTSDTQQNIRLFFHNSRLIRRIQQNKIYKKFRDLTRN